MARKRGAGGRVALISSNQDETDISRAIPPGSHELSESPSDLGHRELVEPHLGEPTCTPVEGCPVEIVDSSNA